MVGALYVIEVEVTLLKVWNLLIALIILLSSNSIGASECDQDLAQHERSRCYSDKVNEIGSKISARMAEISNSFVYPQQHLKAQVGWEVYSYAHCNATQLWDGAAGAIEYNMCMLKLSERRLLELEDVLNCTDNGCPARKLHLEPANAFRVSCTETSLTIWGSSPSWLPDSNVYPMWDHLDYLRSFVAYPLNSQTCMVEGRKINFETQVISGNFGLDDIVLRLSNESEKLEVNLRKSGVLTKVDVSGSGVRTCEANSNDEYRLSRLERKAYDNCTSRDW